MRRFTQFLFVFGMIFVLGACGQDNAASNSDEFIGEQLNYQIVGIDPGAGLMGQAEEALAEYELDNDWEILESSGAAMMAELSNAIDNKEPIIVTGWVPHWKFLKYDLKFLDDPKNAFDGEHQIHTVVRQGLKDDMPEVYEFFSRFAWDLENMQEVMLNIEEEEMPEEEAAKLWVEENEDMVETWIDGIGQGNGETIKIPYVAWVDMIASTYVVKHVLENELNYNVELMQVEAGPMFASIAEGDTDAMMSLSLPATHAEYHEEFGDDYEKLGVSLEGALNGFVVPEYMDIDSIEDLIKE